MHRLMLATLISQMENRLLAENSATQTLEHWLREHALLGAHETLRAEREAGAHSPCPPDLLAALDLPTTQGGQSLRYRKIRLAGHNRIYSEAENWFVPERLTKAMTEALEQTDTPFGRVVSPLRFTRQLIRRETLWSPLPELWEMQLHPPNSTTGADPLALPPHLFRHIACYGPMPARRSVWWWKPTPRRPLLLLRPLCVKHRTGQQRQHPHSGKRLSVGETV